MTFIFNIMIIKQVKVCENIQLKKYRKYAKI